MLENIFIHCSKPASSENRVGKHKKNDFMASYDVKCAQSAKAEINYCFNNVPIRFSGCVQEVLGNFLWIFSLQIYLL